MSNKVEATYGPYLNIPENIHAAVAKAIAEKQGYRYSGLSLADKKFYRDLARVAIQTYIAESIRPTEDDSV